MTESKTCNFCYKLVEDDFSVWKVVYAGNNQEGNFIKEQDLCKKCFHKLQK
ncbi:MAG: hypothetical protein Q7R52_03130 [archaeon]|nr:hypothetical protein [archaeon]